MGIIITDKDSYSQYNTDDIASYELIDAKKSGGSTIMRAGIGAAFLGPVGLLAGATAKKKYSVAIHLKNGTTKVIKVSENDLKILIEKVNG